MNLKKVIEYIAEEDLEVNLTLQVGSDSTDGLKEEIRKLRKQIEDLELGNQQIGVNTDAIEPEDEMSFEEAQEKYDKLEIGVDSEDTQVDVEHEEMASEAFQSEEDTEPKDSAQTPEEFYSEDEDQPADPEQAEEEFKEMFGEDEEPDEEPDPEPSEEERDEAEADFEELFGDAV